MSPDAHLKLKYDHSSTHSGTNLCRVVRSPEATSWFTSACLPPIPSSPREAMRTDAMVSDLQDNEPGHGPHPWQVPGAPGVVGGGGGSRRCLPKLTSSAWGENLWAWQQILADSSTMAYIRWKGSWARLTDGRRTCFLAYSFIPWWVCTDRRSQDHCSPFSVLGRKWEARGDVRPQVERGQSFSTCRPSLYSTQRPLRTCHPVGLFRDVKHSREGEEVTVFTEMPHGRRTLFHEMRHNLREY